MKHGFVNLPQVSCTHVLLDASAGIRHQTASGERALIS